MRKLPFYHSFGHKTNEPSVELAERLIALAPVPMSKVFFANSGSEANDTAVKLVWYYHNAIGKPQKKKIISRDRAYHGVTVASASLTGLPNNHRDFDLPIAGILHTVCPGFYRYGEPGESEEAFVARCVRSLEALIEREGRGDYRRLLRRAGDGVRRLHRAAADLLRKNPSGARRSTTFCSSPTK